MAPVDKKGRSKALGRSHFRLYRDMADSPAWLALKPAERAVFMQIGIRCTGTNNGAIAASVRDLAHECNINKDTVWKALKRLVEMGFLEVARQSSFDFKMKRAAEYRITTLVCNVTNAPPSNAWRQWRAD
jgi:DNA-binding MarR family transcriptional regulator